MRVEEVQQAPTSPPLDKEVAKGDKAFTIPPGVTFTTPYPYFSLFHVSSVGTLKIFLKNGTITNQKNLSFYFMSSVQNRFVIGLSWG